MAVRPDFSGLAYWQNRYREIEPQMAFRGRDRAAFDLWKAEFGKKFVECLGKMPPEKLPLDVQVEAEDETEVYTRRKIVYTADRYSRIPAYLFVPKGGTLPAPAVICPHGHGRGKEDPSGIARTDADRAQISKYNYNYAEQFARRGYVSLAPDLRCFGERVDDPATTYGQVQIEEGSHWCDINFILGMLAGYNLLTLHIFDVGRGIDLLQGLREVIPDRIGSVGLSQGGVTTLFSAAFHQRITVAGVSGYLNSWKVFPMMSGQICGSQIVPGLLPYGDHAEVAGLICPRPLFCEFGLQDPIFPIEASRDTYAKVREVYRIAGAPDRIDAEEFDGLHEFRGRKIFDFFARWL
jgi:cephalosporin-C deacetylase-like acetyl esterase